MTKAGSQSNCSSSLPSLLDPGLKWSWGLEVSVTSWCVQFPQYFNNYYMIPDDFMLNLYPCFQYLNGKTQSIKHPFNC